MDNLLRKQTLLIAALIVIFSGGMGVRQAFADKNAFVDVSKVFDEYERTRQNDETLAEEGKKKQAERDNKIQEIRRLKDELALLSDKNKEMKQQAVDEKVKSLQEFDGNVRETLGKKRDETVKMILKDIDEVMSEYGKKNGYDFIFNERSIAFRNPKNDVTVEVLNELNTRYRSKASNK